MQPQPFLQKTTHTSTNHMSGNARRTNDCGVNLRYHFGHLSIQCKRGFEFNAFGICRGDLNDPIGRCLSFSCWKRLRDFEKLLVLVDVSAVLKAACFLVQGAEIANLRGPLVSVGRDACYA